MDAVVLVALIMAAASIVVAVINKAWVRDLHKDILIVLHQTNSMQHEMQRLARAEGKAMAEDAYDKAEDAADKVEADAEMNIELGREQERSDRPSTEGEISIEDVEAIKVKDNK